MIANKTRSIMKMIWSVLRPRWFKMMMLILLVPAVSVLGLIQPFLLKQIVDNHLKIGFSQGLGLLAMLYILTFVAIQGVSFLQTYIAASVGQNALRDLRIRLFRHIGHLPISYFDQTPTGDTISRCTSDVDAVGMLFSSTILGIFSDIVQLGGIIIAMVVLNVKLTLVALVVMPIVFVISRIFRTRILTAERRIRLLIGETNIHLQETLTGMEVIRAFGRKEAFQDRFHSIQEGYLRAVDRSGIYASVFSPLIETVRAISIALLLWYGTRASVFISWGVTLGTLAAFVQLIDKFFQPITSLGQEYQSIQQAVAGAERIFQVLELQVEQRPPVQSIDLRSVNPDIECRNVIFSYVPGNPILRDINLLLDPGEHVAIVGRTGAGKSSLVHLIAGLYTPEAGTVRIGGIDPRGLVPEQRHRLVGIVPQQVHIFDGTVLDNLRMGDESISVEEVWIALELANASELVRDMPEGLNTRLGAGAVRLSNGQQQLLSLARALVGNPKILFLDEATASVDSETERIIRNGLKRSSVGRTTITIAHRLASAQDADRVIVMSDGRIVEDDRPENLVTAGKWYASMSELQKFGWINTE